MNPTLVLGFFGFCAMLAAVAGVDLLMIAAHYVH